MEAKITRQLHNDHKYIETSLKAQFLTSQVVLNLQIHPLKTHVKANK